MTEEGIEDFEWEKMMKETVLFEGAVSKHVSEKRGELVEFTCPLCGGKAWVSRSTYNGHIWSKCESCGMSSME